MEEKAVKLEVHNACVELVKFKIEELYGILKNFQDAANEETKSSAGDKYETGRAMMQLEKEKVGGQLEQMLKQDKVLKQLNPLKESSKAEHGSLLETNLGWFYISASLGKIGQNPEVMCISPVSPLGAQFIGKAMGDQVSFGNRTYTLLLVS